MLPEVHDTLRRLIYEHGRISQREVDIRFDAPTKEWIGRLTRPTINLFLFDLQENLDLRHTNPQVARGNGRAVRRLPPRRIDLHFLVSVLTPEIEDEHRLLWRTLAALLKNRDVPAELLPEELRRLELPLTTQVASADKAPRLLDVWTALNVEPHPAVDYVVTAPLDLELTVELPLVLARTVRYRNVMEDRAPEAFLNIGGVVRGQTGEPVAGVTVTRDGSAANGSITTEDGRFALRNVPSGPLRLRVTRADGWHKTVDLEAPADSYDIILD